MKPDLVCKIEVQTADGKTHRGSGYPITPNRIITAAHVVADAVRTEGHAAESSAWQIKLFFGAQNRPVDAPVSIEWCGTDDDVDVAVLRCDLPPELQPAHRLLTAPPETPIKWFAHGYTDFGKQKRPGGKDDYSGTLTQFSDTGATVPLGCDTGPITAKEWQGGSGSVAFDSETSQTALAVITDYQGGKKHDQLVAVPICYLLNAAPIREGFRRAIQFDTYQHHEGYRERVIGVVASKLQAFGEPLKGVAQAVCERPEVRASSGINLKSSDEELAKDVAVCLVDHLPIDVAVGFLIGQMSELSQDHADALADIVDYLLPLNYAPHAIHHLREQLSAGTLGIVADEVVSRTLAEIIMAGYDQKSAKYIDVSRRKADDIAGFTALPYHEGPEEGPDFHTSEQTQLLRSIRNMLRDLVALRDDVLGLDRAQSRQEDAAKLRDADLTQEISGYATKLQGSLRSSRNIDGRSLYCVLPPPKNEAHGHARRRVLEGVTTHVPGLLFVELMEDHRADVREWEIRDYIIARLVRTQNRR